MDGRRALIDTGLILCSIMTFAMTIMLLAYFSCGDTTSPLPYYVADRAVAAPDGNFGAPLKNLTGREFTDHPFFEDLLVHRNKLLYSLKPGQVLLIGRENFRSYFDGGMSFRWRVLSDEENAYLSQFTGHVVSYDGHYYFIRKEGNEPVRPCGNGTQC